MRDWFANAARIGHRVRAHAARWPRLAAAAAVLPCMQPQLDVAFTDYGDVNSSGTVNVADAVCILLGSLWALQGQPADAGPPVCLTGDIAFADLDCDGAITVADTQLAIYLSIGAPLPGALDAAGRGCADACVPSCCSSPTQCAACPEGIPCLLDAHCASDNCEADLCEPSADPLGDLDLFAHWRFDGNGQDDSGNGFHVTSNSGTFIPGRHGLALQFFGTQSAVVPSAPHFQWGDGDSRYTLTYWIHAAAPSGQWRSVIRKGNGLDCCELGMRHPAHFLYPSDMAVAPVHGTQSAGNDHATVGPIPVNTWVHYAETYDQQFKRAYLDGALIAQWPATQVVGHPGALIFGNDGFYGPSSFALDNVRVYRRTLTPAELQLDLDTP